MKIFKLATKQLLLSDFKVWFLCLALFYNGAAFAQEPIQPSPFDPCTWATFIIPV